MIATATVFIVDDDAAVRASLRFLLEQEGMAIEDHASAESFLRSYQPVVPSCAIVDISMPGMTGLELQAALSGQGQLLPIIFLTGHGDIPTSVMAMKAGAVDFLTKSSSPDLILHGVLNGLAESARLDALTRTSRRARQRVAGLTGREREVMALASHGLSNKAIARRLGISHRTVEIHRGRVMSKIGAATVLELAQIAEVSGIRRSADHLESGSSLQ